MAFGSRKSKAELRRAFEARVWRDAERFSEYFENKVKLAQHVNIEDDELQDFIIPLESMRIQARVQCFDNPNQLLRAFAEVRLPSKKFVEKQNRVPKDSRCHNCNSRNHWAKDCLKRLRVRGSCYGCGAKEHLIAQWPQRKKPKDKVNNYSAS
ncbi:uncharacterized protein LOC124461166 [Drosophila willistoni]|uniref:uncharacterized protein LOC124461166 n=1 Tax=Drosophila willistoni TaxID=7260 RepID=UPI001F0810D7|nr:uncharacterized protein LOC124461166 [Drosophila willistoni]